MRTYLAGDLVHALYNCEFARIQTDTGASEREALQWVREQVVERFGAPTGNQDLDAQRNTILAIIDRGLNPPPGGPVCRLRM